MRTEQQLASMRAYVKARREQMKADGRCIDCTGRMLPEWPGAICPSCREGRAESARKYAASHRDQRNQMSRRLYAANRGDRRAYRKARYWRLKAAGLCVWCTRPAAEASVYCGEHQERQNAVRRKGGRHMNESVAANVAAGASNGAARGVAPRNS